MTSTNSSSLLLSGVVLFAFSAPFSAETFGVSDEDILDSYRKHAALAQYYRWYQFYERPEGGLENAVDILAADILLRSSLGEARGLEEYKKRAAQIPSHWSNAHFVESVEVDATDDGALTLTAKITYLNEGMRDDDKVRAADLTYSTELAQTGELLPKFTRIEITQDAVHEAERFVDAYAENRALSVVHYWLAIIEAPARDPEPAREILSDGFSLNFTSGAITDFDGFRTWLAGTGSSVSASMHDIRNVSVKAADDMGISVSMDFNWFGITPDGTRLIAETRHNWTLTNDVSERFARIKAMDVELVTPFQPASAN